LVKRITGSSASAHSHGEDVPWLLSVADVSIIIFPYRPGSKVVLAFIRIVAARVW